MTYLKPGAATRAGNWVALKLRLKPALTVTGRRSGQPRTVPVNVLAHEGRRYLLSPRGNTEWARNLRAAGRAEISRRSSREEIVTSEVDDALKPVLIAAYRKRWDRESKAYWKALPDPADHPVFEIHTP